MIALDKEELKVVILVVIILLDLKDVSDKGLIKEGFKKHEGTVYSIKKVLG